ncbi:Phosphatidate phosphatase APP1 [Pontibacter akesuensis]|uniref:Phosphatidate phosphatase APP1 n=1 Tax=Pontibacter akesuensis TaxID=388950 RepID=A0A1I7HRS2_9BACT|nr:Phosphatidate phosphatase APP1 [Pontibacter akesuensis]
MDEALVQLGQELDAGREQLKENLHLLRPIMILPFYGYGSDTYVYLKGRVIEKDKKQNDGQEEHALEQSLSMLRRFALSAIPNIRLSVAFAGQQQEVETDKEGYFEVEFNTETPINYKETGYTVQLKLLERKTDEDAMEAEGRIFVPQDDARFGVVSDIDDTVLVANATSTLGQLKRTLLQDAQERSPFPGIASLLQVLKGRNNPLVYVSSGQWNLYSFLVSFMEAHHIPKGPILLRDHGSENEEDDKRQHKLEQIRAVLRTYPRLSFILIGDSGKDDPEIYRQVSQEFPDQVKCIYIRDVTEDGRAKEVQEICRQVEQQDVQMLLVKDSVAAAEHAFKHGYISLEQLHQVQEAQRQEQRSKEE